jgi:Putative peptidoglycan binding domain
MKTKALWIAVLASAALSAQAQVGAVHPTGGGIHRGAVPHAAPPVHASAPARGLSSMHSMPARSFGRRMIYPGQRYSSFATRPSQPLAFRRPNMNPNRVTYTRSGPYTVATIRQPNQINRLERFANYRNRAATNVWNQRNSPNQFRNGNNHLRSDWQKHVFARGSGAWHRDWDRHSDHWWNGHRCSFINGTWVIFNLGFSPWWPSYYPNDYYYDYGFPNDGYGSSTYGYDYPYSYNYDPGYYNSGDYQGQMYYDQNGYPDQSQGYYDSAVYQSQVYDDPNSYSDQSQSNYSTVVAAQERLAHEGYYHGESDGALNPEMQKAVRRYQITNGLRATGYLDADTLAVMGLQQGANY